MGFDQIVTRDRRWWWNWFALWRMVNACIQGRHISRLSSMKWYNNLEDHQTSLLTKCELHGKGKVINYKELVDIVLQAHIHVSNLSRSFPIDLVNVTCSSMNLHFVRGFSKAILHTSFSPNNSLILHMIMIAAPATVLPSLWVTLGRWWHTCLLSPLLPVLPRLGWLISTITPSDI